MGLLERGAYLRWGGGVNRGFKVTYSLMDILAMSQSHSSDLEPAVRFLPNFTLLIILLIQLIGT